MENKKLICKKCGANLGVEDKFCPECGYKDPFEKIVEIAESPFFTFAKPYLEFISKEKLYSLFYFVMAAISLIIPFVILYASIDMGVFKAPAKYVFAFVFIWLVIGFACFIGFQLWWDRRKNVTNMDSAEFIAIPAFSEILQTFGEWLGTLFGIIGAGSALIALIFLGGDLSLFRGIAGMGSIMGFGAAGIITCPIIGILIIIFFRILAESLRIVAALANNTKEIAKNIKNNSNGV